MSSVYTTKKGHKAIEINHTKRVLFSPLSADIQNAVDDLSIVSWGEGGKKGYGEGGSVSLEHYSLPLYHHIFSSAKPQYNNNRQYPIFSLGPMRNVRPYFTALLIITNCIN
jgi:hypothetical protein